MSLKRKNIMDVECVKEKLNTAVSIASKATGRHASLPILSGIYISAEKSKLVVRATNLDIGIEIEVPAKVKQEGEVVLPGGVFLQLLNNLQGDKKVVITQTDHHTRVQTESSDTKINGYAPDEFPSLPVVNEGEGFSIESKKITEGIKSVVYSASTSDIKPELASVYVYPNNEDIVFVSTDSFRLAEKRCAVGKIPKFQGVLIPFKNANDIASALDSIEEKVDIRFSNTQIAFSVGDMYITSRLIEGTFPDYGQIIPKEEKTQAIVLKQDLINLLKLNTIFTNKFNQVFFSIKPKDKVFSIETKNTNIGENKTTIDASLSGDDVDMSVNYKYISDALPTIKDDSVSFTFNGPNKPIVLQGVSNKTFRYLVMPMNR